MISHPPKEREWVSWAYAIVWSGLIFIIIPVARAISDFVRDNLGGSAFTYGVATIMLLGLITMLGLLFRRRDVGWGQYAWLAAVGAAYLYFIFVLKDGSPEEAAHYVMYGGLGLLLYRALVHRVRDWSIYLVAALIGTFVGIMDETIQWLTPKRYFDTRDIWLNFTGVALAQVAIAQGLRPKLIAGAPGLGSWRRVCYMAALNLGVLGLFHLNTPANVARYTEVIPGIEHWRRFDDVMFEFGYRHEDPETGPFKSRLTLEQIAAESAERAEEGGAILDDHHGRRNYNRFHRTYTSYADPLLHELRTRLASRDTNLRRARQAEDAEERRRRYSFAALEQRIAEKYFGPVAAASARYAWTPEIRAEVEAGRDPGLRRESLVSKGLITRYTQVQGVAAFLSATFLLLLLAQLLRRRPEN